MLKSVLAAHARVWIYQAARPLTEAELQWAAPRLAAFVAGWASHGQALALAATAEFRHRQFLVIGLDEQAAGASGCSIDASVRFVQELGQALGVELLDKSRMAFLIDDDARDGSVAPSLLTRAELRAAIAAGQVRADTPYFNNTVGTQAELAAHWPAPAGETWLRSFFERA